MRPPSLMTLTLTTLASPSTPTRARKTSRKNKRLLPKNSKRSKLLKSKTRRKPRLLRKRKKLPRKKKKKPTSRSKRTNPNHLTLSPPPLPTHLMALLINLRSLPRFNLRDTSTTRSIRDTIREMKMRRAKMRLMEPSQTWYKYLKLEMLTVLRCMVIEAITELIRVYYLSEL